MTKKMLDVLLDEQPLCIYCRNDLRVNKMDASREHLPEISIFDNRIRPKGLEVLACKKCNTKYKDDDQFIALFSRMYPDPDTIDKKKEFSERFDAVCKIMPDIIHEIKSGDDLSGFKIRGPLVYEQLIRFGYRMGLALHYQLYKDKQPQNLNQAILNQGDEIIVNWFLNSEFDPNKVPVYLGMDPSILGDLKTLVQGKKTVADQFQYRSEFAYPTSNSMHIATFRESFGIIAFVGKSISGNPLVHNQPSKTGIFSRVLNNNGIITTDLVSYY